MRREDLNQRLFEVCTAGFIDYALAEELLRQGAEPMGRIVAYGRPDNLYTRVMDRLFANDDTPEDFFRITELFVQYGLDIGKPSVPYGSSTALHPLWMFAFSSNEWVLRSLRLLLDNGLRAEDAAECWKHAIGDYMISFSRLENRRCYEGYYDYIRKLMLIASYPHVVNADRELRDEIWYAWNHYDLRRFRSWEDFDIIVDTGRCTHGPDVRRSLVTLRERATGKDVWIFGVCLEPTEVFGGEPVYEVPGFPHG